MIVLKTPFPHFTEGAFTWNHRLLTTLLRTNKGRIQSALNVQDSIGPIQDHTTLWVSEPPGDNSTCN